MSYGVVDKLEMGQILTLKLNLTLKVKVYCPPPQKKKEKKKKKKKKKNNSDLNQSALRL